MTATPVMDQKEGIQLIDMRGLDYDDPKWDTFIQQLTLDELTISFGGGGWTEYPLEEYGIPYAYGCDGPAGLYSFVLSGVDTYYPHFSETTLTATWNVELAAEYGDALAEEAQIQRKITNAQASITYLFGPGANFHRHGSHCCDLEKESIIPSTMRQPRIRGCLFVSYRIAE